MAQLLRRPLLLAVAFWVLGPSLGLRAQAQYNLETVPNPKASPSYDLVADPDGIIGAEYESRINALVNNLEQQTTIQFAVVALQSIGHEPAESFATDLFNHWGVGQKETNNGGLLLLVMDQKRWQVATGYGLETVYTDAMCVRVGEEVMVPLFREGKFGEGMYRYTERFVQLMTDSTALAELNEQLTPHPYDFQLSERTQSWLSYYLGASALVALLGLAFVGVALSNPSPYRGYQQLYPFGHLIWGILFVAPYLLVYFVVRRTLRYLRNKPRASATTGEPLVKLDEKADDAHLDKGQRKEEEIKSIDYDVWVNPRKPSDILVLPYKKFFSSYFRCSKCNYRTGYSWSETITPATYSSSGQGKKTTACKHCSHRSVSYYTIPQKTQSSSSSSGGGGGGGSSFGGGSSGGGGGGGSW